jgi:alkylhydroperoxidase family enzyme
VGRAAGITEEQLRDLSRFEESPHFSELEKLALRLSVAMTATPAEVPPELFAALRKELGDPQLVELVAEIAWEQFRSRFNRVFDVGSQGFSEGAFCPLPEHRGSPRRA